MYRDTSKQSLCEDVRWTNQCVKSDISRDVRSPRVNMSSSRFHLSLFPVCNIFEEKRGLFAGLSVRLHEAGNNLELRKEKCSVVIDSLPQSTNNMIQHYSIPCK